MRMKLLAVALSAIGVVGSAHAGAIAQSTTTISDFKFLNAATGLLLDARQFDRLNIIDTTNLSPSFGGVFNSFTGQSFNGAPLGFNQRCIGPMGNTSCAAFPAPFTPETSPAMKEGAMSASNLTGAPITGLFDQFGNPVGTPATAQTDAVASRLSPGAANTSTSLTLASNFSFSTTNDLAVIIDFTGFLRLLADVRPSINAFAGSGFNIRISDQATGATVFDWTPNGQPGGIVGGMEIRDDCNLTRSITAFFPNGHSEITCAPGSRFTAVTPILFAANTYDLSLTQQNQANVLVGQAVPEPSSLLLAGFALACLGGVGFRRKSGSGN